MSLSGMETISNKLKSAVSEIDLHYFDVDIINIVKRIYELLDNKLLHLSEQEYSCLAGTSGSLINVLENSALSYSCKSAAAKCLHRLTFVELQPNKEKYLPSEVVVAIQKVCIHFLQKESPSTSSHLRTEHLHMVVVSLIMLINLVINSPAEVLGSSIIKASYPFIFYNCKGIGKLNIVEGDISLSSQVLDQETDQVKNYTNRNRRKRLRRKKTQPSSLILKSSENARKIPAAVFVPHRLPPSTQAISDISLKPQWMTTVASSNIAEKRVPNSISHTNTSVTHHENCKLDEESNYIYNNDSSFTTSDTQLSTSIVELEELFCDKQDVDSSIGLDARVRQYALSTINAVITKVNPQNKFSFWPQMMCQTPSLITCILRDTSPTVRMTALQVVNSFLIDSRHVLSMASEDDKSSSSYTSLGKQLGSSIRELHRCLILALLSEKTSSFLVRILKTLELLVENVKYPNLKPGLLTKTVTHVKYFLRYKDAVVRANAFSFMVSMLMMKPQFPELKSLLTRYPIPITSLTCLPLVKSPDPCEEDITSEQLEEEDNEFESQMENLNLFSKGSFSSDSGSEVEGGTPTTMVSWLVQRCVDSLLLMKNIDYVQGLYIQVQLQSLKVLSALVSEHLNIIKSSLPVIQRVITVCCELKTTDKAKDLCRNNSLELNYDEEVETTPSFVSSDPEIVVEHAFLLLGSLLNAVKSHLEKKHKLESDEESCVTPQLALQLWLWSLQEPLKPLIEMSKSANEAQDKFTQRNCDHNDFNVKSISAAANVLTHLCSHVLQLIGESLLKVIINTVNFLLHHHENLLQLSGIRIMAIIVAYSPVQEHVNGPSLISSTIKIATMSLEQDSNVNKDRLLAFWALSNVISYISVYKDLPDKTIYESLVNKESMLTTLQSAIHGCSDKDKIRPHAVRCVGNVISLLTTPLVNDREIASEVNKAIETLIECSHNGNNMKMRWNACQALGVVLSSRVLNIDSAQWRSTVLKSLCSLVECFKNYKVRIQACAALCCPVNRSTYGHEYYLVWKSVLLGFEDSQNISDYVKVQHRDDFTNHLCVTLCHLICILRMEDLDGLSDMLLNSHDTAKILVKKSNKNLPPERVSCILKAIQKISELMCADMLTAPQEQSLCLLDDIFNDIK